MKSNEIRQRFLDFFEKRDHAILESASLLTTDEAGVTNSTLFNTAGMQPLVPYLMGKEHPMGKRLVSSQKCLRTVDIEDVGDNTHATFFEMLGNWSLGDYFKNESINWSWEFLTDKKEGLGLNPNRIFVTVFSGGKIDGRDIGRDDESVLVWKEIFNNVGIDPEKHIFYKLIDNWWSAGDNSPAGTTTEIFYDLSGEFERGLNQEDFEKFESEQKIVEIWNNVFMEYEKQNGVVISELKNKNVDTGAGLERLTAVLQGVSSLAETDLYKPLIDLIKENSEAYDERQGRIIADHIKTAIFLIQDGVVISNTGRGYILRKILRRAYNSLESIKCLPTKIMLPAIHIIVEMYRDLYFKGVDEKQIATKIQIITTEMDKVLVIMRRGVKIFKKIKDNPNTIITGKFLMDLEQSHGLPLNISLDIAKQLGVNIPDKAIKEIDDLRKQHQNISRKGAAGKFKGGLAGNSAKITALHTATHLMLAGLRKYLGDDVYQKGSNITEERIRFDFTHPEKVSREILDHVEKYVNNAINSDAKVVMEKMNKNVAMESGVSGAFWEKYPDEVDVYSIDNSDGNNYSRELCGGPHVANMSEIREFGVFRVGKEASISAGVRRIKATLDK